MSQFAGSIGAAPRPAPSPHDMRRVQSTGHLTSGMKRVPSAPAMRRPPSSGRLAEHGEEARGRERATHSRNSGGGSELFDALLLAATGARGAALCCAALCVHAAGRLAAREALKRPSWIVDWPARPGAAAGKCSALVVIPARYITKEKIDSVHQTCVCTPPPAEDRAAGLASRGEPPVTSLHYPTAQLGRQRSGRGWLSGEVDSLQNAIDAFKVGRVLASQALPAQLLSMQCTYSRGAAAVHAKLGTAAALPLHASN